MPTFRCRRECESVNLMLITIIHDATEGVLPLWEVSSGEVLAISNFMRVGGRVFVYCQVYLY
jgi:hypothetical protein